jgi:hypothetical protein
MTFALSLTAYAAEKINCRTAVVLGYASLGVEINASSFSTSTFTQENITVEEFNAMPSEQQEEVYTRIKPLSVVVSDLIKEISLFVEQYAGTIAEIKYPDFFANLRDKRVDLRSCVE